MLNIMRINILLFVIITSTLLSCSNRPAYVNLLELSNEKNIADRKENIFLSAIGYVSYSPNDASEVVQYQKIIEELRLSGVVFSVTTAEGSDHEHLWVEHGRSAETLHSLTKYYIFHPWKPKNKFQPESRPQ